MKTKNKPIKMYSAKEVLNAIDKIYKLRDLKKQIYQETIWFWVFIILITITSVMAFNIDNIWCVRIYFTLSIVMIILDCYIYNKENKLEDNYKKLGGNTDEL